MPLFGLFSPPAGSRLGPVGERLAERFLRRKGYKVLLRNFRLPAGEVDLIARDGGTLVFVEVKTRTSSDRNDPQAQVNLHKQRQIARVARIYLTKYEGAEPPHRFDVVAITYGDGTAPAIHHIESAFTS